MRRKEREITDKEKIFSIMNNCEAGVIGLIDQGEPYTIPINLISMYQDGKFVLFFHSASKGKKLNLIEKNPKISFSMFTDTHFILNDEKGVPTMKYRSVCGKGIATIINQDENTAVLKLLMCKYAPDSNFEVTDKMGKIVKIVRIDVEEIYGKSNIIEKSNDY
ncbi:MAG: pyridoxamine 5'-phosphate oxidase family protein [Bacteroidales bacterium]